jgi:hypothetical protein
VPLPIALLKLLLVAFVVFVVGVVVFVVAILLFIHMLRVLLRLMLGPAVSLISVILNKKQRTREKIGQSKRQHVPFTIPVVSTLGLGQLVDLGPGKTDQQFLGKGVVDRLALLALVVLESLEGGKSCTPGDHFV